MCKARVIIFSQCAYVSIALKSHTCCLRVMSVLPVHRFWITIPACRWLHGPTLALTQYSPKPALPAQKGYPERDVISPPVAMWKQSAAVEVTFNLTLGVSASHNAVFQSQFQHGPDTRQTGWLIPRKPPSPRLASFSKDITSNLEISPSVSASKNKIHSCVPQVVDVFFLCAPRQLWKISQLLASPRARNQTFSHFESW